MIHSATPKLDNLTGAFLISTPKMPDPRFCEQVILICAHSEEGAMGICINKPNNLFSMQDILIEADMHIPDYELPPVYIGGPVELESAFIVYTGYSTEHELQITPNLSLSRQASVLEDIANGRGPDKYIFFLGYAGWGPGQLEMELLDDGWLIVPSDEHIIFDVDDDEKWRTAAMHYGIDIATYIDAIGYA